MPDTLRTEAARALLGTMPLVNRTIGRAMRQNMCEGSALLPQQYRLLGAIRRKPRTLGEVACIQGVTPATATTLVTTLEGRGWVVREHDPDDRRRTIVSLTEVGVRAFESSQRVAEAAIADLLGSLSSEELERLRDGFSVLQRL